MEQTGGEAPSGPPPETRRRAAALRTEAGALRARSAALKEQSRTISDATVRTLLEADTGRRDTPERFSFRAARLRSSLALVRRRLRRWLESGGVDPEEAADITLACSEACANAIEHPLEPARQVFEVEGTRTDEGIELRVRDFGVWRPGRESDTRGRGLQMIRQLMDSTEVVAGDHETTIVMRRARRRQPA